MSERLDSRDETLHWSVNGWEVNTDPNTLDSYIINGALVSQYPRTIWLIVGTVIPDDVTAAYGEYLWNAVTPYLDAFYNTFLTKNPVIDYTTEITFVPASPTHFYFPRGGLWNIDLLFRNMNLFIAEQYVVGKLEYSNNNGAGFGELASSQSGIATDIGPFPASSHISTTLYVPASSGSHRFRVSVATNLPLPNGVILEAKLTKLRN